MLCYIYILYYIYVIFTYVKPVFKSFIREIWLYNQGDLNSVRQRVASYDCDPVKSEDKKILMYMLQISNTLINLDKDCIPHKYVGVRPQDLP